MIRLRQPAFVLTGTALLALTVSSQAVISVVGNFRLGETDPGAAAGNPGGATTDNAAGLPDLTLLDTAPVYVSPGVSGSSLAMDFSSGGYFSPTLVNTNNDWGIEAWVQGDSGSAISAIAYNGNSANAGMGIYQFNNTYIGLMGGIAFVGSTPVSANWTHLAMVVNGGATTFYVNGVANATVGAPNIPAGNFNIGTRPDGGERFDGRIDEVRVFTFAPGQFDVSDLQFNGVVPEPGVALLLAGGGLALVRRRRRSVIGNR